MGWKYKCFIWLVKLAFLFGEVHTCKDQYGTKDEIDRDLFWENDPRKEDGGDGIEIDVVGGDNGS